MTGLIQQQPTLAARALSRLVLAVVALLLAASAADAALTTGACLAQKQTAWGDLRKCQATERAKVLKGKAADLTKCQTKFQEKLAKIGSKATKAVIDCRYGDNGDGTVTDYDTGLQWEKKDGEVGGICLLIFGLPNHCVNFTYTWKDASVFIGELNGTTPNGMTLTAPFAGYADWRLPTLTELLTIVDGSVPGCGSGSACIDPIFGPTVINSYFYWSATNNPGINFAWYVNFGFANSVNVNDSPHGVAWAVRAVRTGL